jgi:hypothetical protein
MAYATDIYQNKFTYVTKYLTRRGSGAQLRIIRQTVFVAFRLVVCGSRVLFRVT